MALNKSQKKQIRRIGGCKCYGLDDAGKPMYTDVTQVPSMLKLRHDMIRKLEEAGYEVKFVKPENANCFIRVFKNGGFQYQGDDTCLYGGYCYVKSSMCGRWTTEGNSGWEVPARYDKHVVRQWFYQDDYEDVETDFFDTYVMLAPKKI